jgi:hypothetical protein
MTRWYLILPLVFTMALSACSSHEPANAISSAPANEARSQDAAKDGEAPARQEYLAYEHSVTLDVVEGQVAAVFELARRACKEAAADACTLLDSDVSKGRDTSGSIKLRAKRSGIQKVLAALSTQGDFTRQSTTAQDLSGPITDNAKKLAMLIAYRAKLEALLARAGNDIESLIKLNRELAQTQNDIEALNGQQTNLVQRVDTEILTIHIESVERRSFWKPISHALDNFGSNLSEGISTALTAIAYLLPWMFIIGVMVWVFRMLWKWTRRKPAKTTAP